MLARFFSAGLLILVATVHGKRQRGSPGVQVASGECLFCQVAVVAVLLAGGMGVSSYCCLTDQAQEGDGESEMSYSINLPTPFVNEHKVTLDSGVSTICIMGGTAIRTEFGEPDYIIIPPKADIHFVASRANRNRRLVVQTTGIRSLLVVLVKAPNSLQSNSLTSLANGTFGTGGQQYSVASQYSSCSAGKLTFVAASGFPNKIVNGVMELQLNTSINNKNFSDIQNSLTIGVKGALGIGVTELGSIFSNIMFCIPHGTLRSNSEYWQAWAYVPGQYSYFNNERCASLSANIHELGHNLGLQHSGEDGNEYADQSCVMGFGYPYSGYPAMCFNGHKNYVLGWYADKQIIVNPASNGAWSGRLVGFMDYTQASTSRNEYVLIVVGNLYFIQYNLAKGSNFQVKEKANMITIVTAANTKSISNMVASLSAKQFIVIDTYRIEACDMVNATLTSPKYVTLSVGLNSQVSTCPGATLVTLKPTPTPAPTTSRPSAMPTRMPTKKKKPTKKST